MHPSIGDYIGLPFQPFGRDRNGVDCWGLVRLFYAEQLGIDLPDLLGTYGGVEVRDRVRNAEVMQDTASASWVLVPKGSERPNDVIVIKYGGFPVHVGIVLKDSQFIHAEEGVGSILQRYDSISIKNRIHGFYRHASLA